MQRTTKMISIQNLVKKYGKFVAVDGLSVEIADNETFALLGLNGAGKSTTINVICSLTNKTEGKVLINGLDVDKNAKEIKQIVALSPQESAVANNLTVKENLQLIADLYGIEQNSVQNAIDTFRLEGKADSLAKNLSGGQKRRLSIAMALITNPQVLILDEPTLGLDVKSRRELWDIICRYKSKATIILTTHYLEEAVALADKIGIMRKGKLVALGTADEIIAQTGKDNFEDAFLAVAGGDDNE